MMALQQRTQREVNPHALVRVANEQAGIPVFQGLQHTVKVSPGKADRLTGRSILGRVQQHVDNRLEFPVRRKMGRHLEVDQGQALLRVPEDIVEVRVTVDEDCPVVGKEPYPLRQPGVGSVKKRVRQPVSTPQTRQDHIEHPVSRPGPQDLRRADRCAPGDRPPGLIATA